MLWASPTSALAAKLTLNIIIIIIIIFGASGITIVEKPTSGSEGSLDLQQIEQKIASLNTRKFDKMVDISLATRHYR